MASWPFRLLVSMTLAGGLALMVFAALPADLDVRTDIVGYPTFANFNVTRYLWAYALITVVFPFVTLALYLLLTRAILGPLGLRGPIRHPLPNVEEVPVAAGWPGRFVSLGRTLLVAAVLGLEAAAIEASHEWIAFSLVFLGYGFAVGFVGFVAVRIARLPGVDAAGCLNTIAAPITIAGLYGVSESTEVTVSATGVVHDYPWFPLWLALGAVVALYIWLGLGFARSKTHAECGSLERRALLLVVGPAGLFLLVASLPGALGPVDVFEEGQLLAGSELVRDGFLPWRDLLVAHGLLYDVGNGLVGAEVFENSRWGILAGQELLVQPLSWVALYYLLTFLFGANWLFLLGTQLLVVTGDLFIVHTRFLLLPIILVLLAALLRRPTVARAVAFSSLLVVQVIVTPEALTAAAAYVGTLVLFESFYYERGRGLAAGFRRTWLCAVSILAAVVGWSLFLLAAGVLDDWVFSFTTLIPGHALTGGIPFAISKSDFEVVTPVALVLVVFTFVVARVRLRRPLALQDWVMLAMAVLTFLYFAKFLSRANHFHVDHSFSVAVPLLLYVAYRGITFGEKALLRSARARGLDWFPPRHTLTAPLLLFLLVFMPVSVVDAARSTPGHFGVTVPAEPAVARSGFQRPGEDDAGLIGDVNESLATLLGPGRTIFDFSNAPGLFHYLLDVTPATRYYHVSLAMRRRTQTDLVRLLEKSRPGVVVFTSDGTGRSQASLDGVPNQVRYYDISQYLLDTYVPVLESGGFIFMQRRDRGTRANSELYFHVDSCDWGYVPNFLSVAPESSADALSLSFRSSRTPGRSWAVVVPKNASLGEYQWLELRFAAPLREGRFVLGDLPAVRGDSNRAIAFNAIGRGETTLRVRVGSCSQWHGYRSRTLYLTSSVPQEVVHVRLLNDH